MIIFCKNAMFDTSHSIYVGRCDDKRLGIFLDKDVEPICFLTTDKTPKVVVAKIAHEVNMGTKIYDLGELEG